MAEVIESRVGFFRRSSLGIIIAAVLAFGASSGLPYRTLSHSASTALGVSMVLFAVASTVFANFGLNAVLASGAVCCALAARQRAGRWSAVPGVAVAVSVTAVALAAVFALFG